MKKNTTKIGARSLTSNSLYYLLYEVLNVLFPFLTGMYVARVLLPETVGMVEYARNITQYFVILAYLGIPTYGMREVAKARDNREQLNRLYSELFCINLGSTAVFLAAYIGMVLAVDAFRANIALYLVTGISVAINAINITYLYSGLEEFRFVSIRNIVFKALCFLLLVLFVRGDGDYLVYALITVVGTVGNYVINMLFSGRYVRFTTKNLCFRQHIRPILVLVVVNLAIELYSLVDTTMLGIFCEEENVAYYSYAQKIQKILLQIVNVFTMVLIPRISYYYQKGEIGSYNRLISKTLNILILLALPMIIGVWFVSDYVIVLLYTQAYISSATILKLLLPLLLISPTGYLLGSRVLLATGHENKMPISVCSGAAVNIALNALLIPRYQEAGAAIASVVSELLIMGIYIALGRRYFVLEDMRRDILKILCACAVLAGVCYACSCLPCAAFLIFAAQVACGVCAYFLALLLLREAIVTQYFEKFIRRIRHG